MRGLDELTDVDDPAWPELLLEIEASDVPVEALPAEEGRASATLGQLQVTLRSSLGAVVFHSGGLLVDGGWLRIYGSGTGEMPGLARVNRFPEDVQEGWSAPGGLVLAHDVLGGVFVLNGGDASAHGRPGGPGEIVYFSPDVLEWEALGAGHSSWLVWILAGGLDEFYSLLRWPGWREEIAALKPSEGLTVYPFLWTEEAQEDLSATTRGVVPMAELLGLGGEFAAQFGLADPGFLGQV